ncbi:MAG TPA: hypothetical protein VFT72_19275 [Opitutaceae bacterium]|nr:hypothetical protein [Opitutaceae bacterium]
MYFLFGYEFLEARATTSEREFNLSYRPVTLVGDDEFCRMSYNLKVSAGADGLDWQKALFHSLSPPLRGSLEGAGRRPALPEPPAPWKAQLGGQDPEDSPSVGALADVGHWERWRPRRHLI